MTKKARYLLIAACIIFFALAAPFIVLYVRGIAFDFNTKNFYKTGIISIRSNPKSAQIYLDGQMVKSSEGNIRFLKPKEYEVSLVKQGYQKWTKRLEVSAGQVTWVNPQDVSIFLFLEKPLASTAESSAKDFVAEDDNIYILKENNLILSSWSDIAQKNSFTLPKPADKILFSPGQQSLILIEQETSSSTPVGIFLSFNLKNHSITDLSQLAGPDTKIKFAPNGNLYFIENENLYQIDQAKLQKTLVQKGVLDCLFGKDTFYYIGRQNETLALFASNAPSQPASVLAQNLPLFKTSEIFASFNKQIFVQLDNALYQISSQPVKLADNVSQLHFNPQNSTFVLQSGSELLRLDPAGGKLDFITRTSLPIANPRLAQNANYSLFIKDNKVLALELDPRDSQNEFLLYQGSALSKFEADSQTQKLLVLDNGELKIVQIR